MSTTAEAREKFISNCYCDELEKTLKDVQRVVRKNIGEPQRKQKKAYGRNSVEKETPFKQGDRVWLNNTAVPKGLSRKFHQQWAGPYKVLSRLGNTNYHIEPVSGTGAAEDR